MGEAALDRLEVKARARAAAVPALLVPLHVPAATPFGAAFETVCGEQREQIPLRRVREQLAAHHRGRGEVRDRGQRGAGRGGGAWQQLRGGGRGGAGEDAHQVVVRVGELRAQLHGAQAVRVLRARHHARQGEAHRDVGAHPDRPGLAAAAAARQVDARLAALGVLVQVRVGLALEEALYEDE